MRILVTGGTGTISSGIVKESVGRGYNTYALTRGNNKYRNVENVHYLYCNIWDKNSVKQVIGDLTFDIVVECLVYNVDQLKISLKNFSDICTQYVFISSTSVFSGNDNAIISEKDIRKGISWSYSFKKIQCEDYLFNFFKNRENSYTIIRPSVTYGNYRVPYPVSTRKPVWSFFDRMINKKPMVSCDNVKFSVIHIDDFSKAVVSLFGNENALNTDYNIASQKSTIYWDDVVKIASKELGIDYHIIHVPLDCFDVIWPEIYDEIKFNKSKSKVVSSEKLEEVIKEFDIKVKIDDGIYKMIKASKEEFETNRYVIDSDWNLNCDLIILYAYKKEKISGDDIEYLSNYYKRLSKTEFEILNNELKKRIVKFWLRRLKKVIKNWV